MFGERAEKRLMHLYGSEALSRLAVEGHYGWLEGYLQRPECKDRRARDYALLEEKPADAPEGDIAGSKAPTPFRACEKVAVVVRLRRW